MSYNPLHDCPANPCVVPGKLAGQGQVFLGLSVNDTVAIAVLSELVRAYGDCHGGMSDSVRESAVRYAFAVADEFCAQRYARAKASQVGGGKGTAG